MTSIRSLISLAAMTAFATVASAQSPAPTRTDVKADAEAAAKSGTTAKGQMPGASSAGSTAAKSGTSRAQVKNEARAAVKNNETAKGNVSHQGPEKAPKGSTKSRAQVKAEAANAGISAPAGQPQTQNSNR